MKGTGNAPPTMVVCSTVLPVAVCISIIAVEVCMMVKV